MRRGEPLTVRLWRCNACYRILGQELEDGVPKHLPPQCGCGSVLGLSRVNAEDW
jgi:hypothetical protein